MAKISPKARKKLAASKFALPGKSGKPGKYPVPDAAHAANAKARASEMVAKGKLSAAKAAKIRHSTDAVLGKHDTSYHNKG
jgi:hypothetical protein